MRWEGEGIFICTTGTVLVTRCMCGTGTRIVPLYTRTMKSNIRRSTAVVCTSTSSIFYIFKNISTCSTGYV